MKQAVKQTFKVMIGFLMLWATLAQAEVRIEITEGVNSAQPIAVVPFKWSGSATPPQDVGQIISADLRNSGKFNPIEPSRMPQQPATASKLFLMHGQLWGSMLWLSGKFNRQQTVTLL